MDNKGFSLIEVLIAIVLISLVLGSFAVIMGTGFDGIFTASHKNKAVYDAQNIIEEKIAEDADGEIVDINIKLPGGITVYANGKVIEGHGVEKKATSELSTFIPDTVEVEEDD